jgi:hypothetical protein
MNKKIRLIFAISFVLCTLVIACGTTPSVSKEDQLATIVVGTLTAQPVAFTPIPTLTVTSVPTVVVNTVVASNGPVYITTRAQNVNLRIQPGTLFPVSRVMSQGTRLQVFGISPGGEWVYILNDEGINGWVDKNFVDEFPTEQFPSVEPGDVQRISGRVVDLNGIPISGIGFAIEQTTVSKSLRTDATTDAFGNFYAYLPKNFSGNWTVSYISISSTSNAMTPECLANTSACGEPEPVSVTVTLPVNTQLDFIWKQ